jgi:hypothetical protein
MVVWKQIGLALALTSSARAMDGNQLHNFCLMKDKAFVTAYTVGLIDKAREDGAAAGFDKFVSTLNFPNTAQNVGALAKGLNEVRDDVVGYCIPDAAKATQGAEVVCKYLADNGAQSNQSAAALVRQALIAAWPCK